MAQQVTSKLSIKQAIKLTPGFLSWTQICYDDTVDFKTALEKLSKGEVHAQGGRPIVPHMKRYLAQCFFSKDGTGSQKLINLVNYFSQPEQERTLADGAKNNLLIDLIITTRGQDRNLSTYLYLNPVYKFLQCTLTDEAKNIFVKFVVDKVNDGYAFDNIVLKEQDDIWDQETEIKKEKLASLEANPSQPTLWMEDMYSLKSLIASHEKNRSEFPKSGYSVPLKDLATEQWFINLNDHKIQAEEAAAAEAAKIQAEEAAAAEAAIIQAEEAAAAEAAIIQAEEAAAEAAIIHGLEELVNTEMIEELGAWSNFFDDVDFA